MINIYMYRNSLNHCSKEELYLIVQTTRILNNSKQFYLISMELYPAIKGDELKAKRLFEVLCHQASALFEVFYVLSNNLAKKYNGHIKKELMDRIDILVDKYRKKNDNRIEVLRDIRNKHGYHIGSDDSYFKKFITDNPTRWDQKIGIGYSSIEQDLIYTIDNALLITFMMDKYKLDELAMYDFIKQSITDYTDDIIDLFRDVLEDLISEMAYVVEK